ncbi:DUF1176 domain-containing protein [Hansschlegelia beijingensis]|uniref:Invasion protein IalB n=1 Tax=Hansschlegelia beijingensis TaxID=1133344 RepID=A0A7W6GFC7_9HYPH|nr:DUF1176 domain-containing protein [Hansschlegelia beijingensis]MBB3971554.1 invasion protein IalB [Hansschlegelia beijingensis]
MTRGGLLTTLAAGLLAGAGTPAAAQDVGPLKTFKDWVVGCDNLRACVALGSSPDEAKTAYVKITRGAAADDEPTVSFHVAPDAEPAAPGLSLVLDGAAPTPLQAALDGSYVVASLPAGKAREVASALKQAKSLAVTLSDGGKLAGSFNISLSGSAAALLFMDDRQGRVGGVTALAKPGPAPASSVPPAPRAPLVKALAMKEVEQPDPLPSGIGKASSDDCKDVPPIELRLEGGKALWGVCTYLAAYNGGFRMWLAGPEGASQVNFAPPGEKPDDAAELTNPYLSEDGLILNAFAKGRGIGDCGEATSWTWDGSAFRLARLMRMEECRGVPQSDWPVLYQAELARD